MLNWTSVEQRWQRMRKHARAIWQSGQLTPEKDNDVEEISLAEENQGVAVSQVAKVEADERKVLIQL